MIGPNDEITSEREVFRMIRAGEFGADFPRREGGRVCPAPRQLLRIANDEVIPEGPQIQEHLSVCPLCRFTLRTFLTGLKDDSSLDPHEDMADDFPVAP